VYKRAFQPPAGGARLASHDRAGVRGKAAAIDAPVTFLRYTAGKEKASAVMRVWLSCATRAGRLLPSFLMESRVAGSATLRLAEVGLARMADHRRRTAAAHDGGEGLGTGDKVLAKAVVAQLHPCTTDAVSPRQNPQDREEHRFLGSCINERAVNPT
jgi:hypothetical protein